MIWSFQDSPNTAVFTTVSVLNLCQPILLVTHDADDGAWQFHSDNCRPSIEDARIVSLQQIVELDSSITELASLPLGWQATRENPDRPWQFSRIKTKD